MSQALHTSPGRTGFLGTVYAGAAMLTAIPLTVLTRALPRRALLIGLLAGFAVVNLATALSSVYLVTVAVRIVAGLFGGVVWSMLAGYAARMVPAEQRGRAIALVLSGIPVGFSLGIPAGTAAATWIGWRGTFGVLAALAVGLIGWVRWQVPAFPGEDAGERAGLVRIARLPGVGAVLLVSGVLLLGHQAMYAFVVPFARSTGLDRPSLVLLVFGLSAVAGIAAVGPLVDRHLRGASIAAIAVVAAALLSLGLLGDSPAVFLAAVALWGLAFGGIPTLLQTALVDAAGPRAADVATSLQTTVYNAGIASGSLVGGIGLDRFGAHVLPWLSLPVVIGALALVLAARQHGFPRERAPLTQAGAYSSSTTCIAASSAEAAAPSMPTSSATRSFSSSACAPSSGLTSRPARSSPTSPS
jgi:predicted MFS family arabinose efflux permease